VKIGYDHTWTFGFLYRLAAKAHRLERMEIFRCLLVGLANRFDAVTSSFYSMSGTEPSRSTEAAHDAEPVAGEIRRLSAAVAKLCRSQRSVVSVLDLPESHAADRHRIEAVLGPCDTFAFPLMAAGRLHGCIVLSLRGDEVLGDADLHALLSIGECLDAALANAKDADRQVDAA